MRDMAEPAFEPRGAEGSAPLHERVRRAWRKVLLRRAAHVLPHSDHSAARWDDAGFGDHLQAATIWFHLQQIIDETTAMRRAREAEEHGTSEGFSQVVAECSNAQRDEITQLIATGHLSVGPTITAHPTEAKRVTVMDIHRRIQRTLEAFETRRCTARDHERLEADLEMEIDLLWLTGELRMERPSLEAEIDWGLQFYRNSLFEAVPRLFERYRVAMSEIVGLDVQEHCCLHFHSWIGGDRDGNPKVTAEVTRLALARSRKMIVEQYLRALDRIIPHLSISNKIIDLPGPQRAALEQIVQTRGTDPQACYARNPNELFRQVCSAIRQALASGRYAHVVDFIGDLRSIEQGLTSIEAELLAQRLIRPLRWQAQTFGFRAHTLDIRQNSDVVTRGLSAVWSSLDAAAAPRPLGPEWSKRLRRELSQTDLPTIDATCLDAEAAELMALLSVIKEVHEGDDPAAIGPFILSMTRSAEDLLAVFLLARYVGFGSEPLSLKVVPLFETIEDLRAAPAILRDVLCVPIAARSMKDRSGRMEIMLGYSDSNKDGGFLCASWTLDTAQRAITRAVTPFGIKPVFFHGRGGSVSRGGAPTDRAIAAQPRGTLNGRLRLTEQGEVVTAKYANTATAVAQLELLTSSVLLHSIGPAFDKVDPEAEDVLDTLSSLSQTCYQTLLQHPAFLMYFNQASPVNELAYLKIGSRPARRFGAESLSDLRAIPWVFAWSQNRHMISSWYGFGRAMHDFRNIRGELGDAALMRVWRNTPLFRLCIDEIEKSLMLVRMDIAELYAGLVEERAKAEAIYQLVETEYSRSVAAIEWITQQAVGQRFPNAAHRIAQREAAILSAHQAQTGLLREVRHNDGLQQRIALMQSMTCISAGLGWTG